MIRLPDASLPEETARALQVLQAEIDQIESYSEQVEAAKRRFTQQNRPGSPVFRVVRATLRTLCSGAARCAYCEDSAADEVEHVRPKDLYPDAVFAWPNYVYACGPCNGAKRNRFAVVSAETGRFVDVTRRRGQPVLPPVPGLPVFIDPRAEDALGSMELDLRDTFAFTPAGEPGSVSYRRADYTIERLKLNRDPLPAARRGAFRSYRSRLHEYVRHRDAGASRDALDDLVAAVRGMGHPTVWREMQRQREFFPELRALFAEAPEALGW